MAVGRAAGVAGTTGPVAPTAADGVAAVAAVAREAGPNVVPSATTAPAAARNTRGKGAASCSRRMDVLWPGGPYRAAAGCRTTWRTAGATTPRQARKGPALRGRGALGASARFIGRQGTFLRRWVPVGAPGQAVAGRRAR